MTTDATLQDNAERHRFELLVGEEVAAYSEYNVLKNALLFTHTEVLPAHEGKGFGSRLVAYALGQVRERGLHAIPACPFVAAYIRKHPEMLDVVSEESRRAFVR
ncbi:N-acetyltransferase [Ramlibacter sp. USB13]|uniref:N-acetyltransferase n=1 Tax=Ramlibacter cellulosilyticus TaxID=2764187 RepID=A0A923MND7_9BURK|nr:GNAT family N-acetyltransferase [Ramlibacter cellulosilyticus]MBC5782273.1 N-acetyltransferase [Ramlibacter cellulosilyticus]